MAMMVQVAEKSAVRIGDRNRRTTTPTYACQPVHCLQRRSSVQSAAYDSVFSSQARPHARTLLPF